MATSTARSEQWKANAHPLGQRFVGVLSRYRVGLGFETVLCGHQHRFEDRARRCANVQALRRNNQRRAVA